MKRILNLFVLVVTVAFLSGCASQKLVLKGGNFSTLGYDKSSTKVTADLMIEPYESLGVIMTPELKKGDVTVVRGQFPKILFGEYGPGRIRWNGIAISQKGEMFFAQVILERSDSCLVLIQGDPKEVSNAKVIILSTLVDYGYDLEGNEFTIDRGKFLENKKEYIARLVNEHGSSVSKLEKVHGFSWVLSNWNEYQTPKGRLLSPLGEEELKIIAAINSRYTYGEKLIASGKFSLSPDYIGTGVGLAIDLIRARGVPSAGWDYRSELPSRRNMGAIIEFVTALREAEKELEK